MSKDKHRIRRILHPQLKVVWENHASLRELFEFRIEIQVDSTQPATITSWVELLADRNKVLSKSNHVHRFAPLVTADNYHGCSLDLLFLRRNMPGGLIKYGGDIDNRLKVLFDALRMPSEPQEVEDVTQSKDENPCFCLLSDDKYIDQISVTTDRLLTPKESDAHVHDVVLVIRVVASTDEFTRPQRRVLRMLDPPRLPVPRTRVCGRRPGTIIAWLRTRPRRRPAR